MEGNTFLLPWGHTILALEDVMRVIGLSNIEWVHMPMLLGDDPGDFRFALGGRSKDIPCPMDEIKPKENKPNM
ncbi:hypothetical protein Taro_021953 [Colocasia esculenta]|uniref:Uncharacterized protein n=1 Tax=Colocasia esculenta TaxID=4460 RepID=A0A843V9U3_COLES|nr:hypothetical protein [Colocasia esculenta]